MVFGLTTFELLLFLKQVGFAVVGAAALWGFVFLIVREQVAHDRYCLVLEWVSERLLFPLFLGGGVAALAWLVMSFMTPAVAHEGVALAPHVEHVHAGLSLLSETVILWVFVTIAGFFVLQSKPRSSYRNLKIFYVLQFLFAALLTSLSTWTGSFDTLQWFYIGHSIHSIFTVGTVLILDFLFLISKSSAILKQHIYPLFPTISKVIWIGLGLDFLSSLLIYSEVFVITPKFLFMQTLIGILIVNGVLLSGPITRKLLLSVAEGGRRMERRWMRIADFAGAVSITSWLTITFVDAFAQLTLGYPTLIASYITIIILLFVGHNVWEYFHQESLPSALAS